MIYQSIVKLVAVTEPLPFLKDQGVDTVEKYLAYIARVSNPDNQINNETSSKLLNYCIKNQHWSVFEQVDYTFEIKTTRDIGRQILRHKAYFQEFSQRYSEVSVDIELFKEARLQDNKNRQSSNQTDDQKLKDDWEYHQQQVLSEAKHVYDWAINKGIAKEVARVVLPEGLTESTMYMKNNLRNWITYCDTRMTDGTQKEHREVALLISEILSKELPFYANYLEKKDTNT